MPADDSDHAYPLEGFPEVPGDDGSSEDESDDLRQDLIANYFTGTVGMWMTYTHPVIHVDSCHVCVECV